MAFPLPPAARRRNLEAGSSRSGPAWTACRSVVATTRSSPTQSHGALRCSHSSGSRSGVRDVAPEPGAYALPWAVKESVRRLYHNRALTVSGVLQTVGYCCAEGTLEACCHHEEARWSSGLPVDATVVRLLSDGIAIASELSTVGPLSQTSSPSSRWEQRLSHRCGRFDASADRRRGKVSRSCSSSRSAMYWTDGWRQRAWPICPHTGTR